MDAFETKKLRYHLSMYCLRLRIKPSCCGESGNIGKPIRNTMACELERSMRQGNRVLCGSLRGKDVYFVIPSDVVMFTYFLNHGVGLTLLYMEKDFAIRRPSR